MYMYTYVYMYRYRASLVTQTVKKSACNAGDPDSFPSLGIPLEKGMATPVFLPGKFHGQRNLVDYNP